MGTCRKYYLSETLFTLYLASALLEVRGQACQSSSIWSWECRNSTCIKEEKGLVREGVQLSTCKLTCGPYGSLWPKPTGATVLGKSTLPFLPTQLQDPIISCMSLECLKNGRIDPNLKWLIENAFYLMRKDLGETYERMRRLNEKVDCVSDSFTRIVSTTIRVLGSAELKLKLDTDESYELNVLTIGSDAKTVNVQITARSFFGVRHALETLSQLTEYDEVHDAMQIISQAQIVDAPAYAYRGVLLDTSRNFFAVESILRLISAMSYSKMNTLHWHITDTHSFPVEINSLPQMTKYGAYSGRKIYSHQDVRKIVEHGRIRGVRVLPEFDQPAHVGNGWQWGEKSGVGKLAVCVNQEPWQKYCVEPPCGQLNVANMNIYPILQKIYDEYFSLFEPDIFHAGGDEVHLNCWNTTEEIMDYTKKVYGDLTEESYMKLWNDFLNKSSEAIFKSNGDKSLPLILWSSHMTDKKYLNKYLDPKKHIIQIWTTTSDADLSNIVLNGFRTIFSTYDTLYLDCGYGNWLTLGNNWCSPYKDWKLYYNNKPSDIFLKNFNITANKTILSSILGQEAAMWSEQVDGESSESKIWPRAAALAERLWTDPDHDWQEAQYRMINHRERLVSRGIHADALQPEWCHQNQGLCYFDSAIQGH